MSGRSLAGAAAAVLLAGCGGGSGTGDRDAARRSVERYFAALARSDAQGACAQMTAVSRTKLAEFGADALRLPGRNSCAGTIGALLRSPAGPALVATAKHARVVHVDGGATGTRARFSVRVSGVNTPITVAGASDGVLAIDSEPIGEPDKAPAGQTP